jgi:CubicO group peptidase (beta-lactamase class C family)
LDGFRALKRGYTRIADTKNNGPVGDKGVCSTLGDLYLWDQALYNGSPIPFEILEEAFQATQSNSGKEIPYGYGFRLRNFENEPVIYHNGVWEGFRTNFHRYPLHRNTIIVLNNSSSRVNHELLTAIETLISRESKKDFTKMLVNISIEEGAESAVEVAKELRLVNPGAGYNLRTMMKAAEFLESSGKPGKAGEVKSLIEKLS